MLPLLPPSRLLLEHCLIALSCVAEPRKALSSAADARDVFEGAAAATAQPSSQERDRSGTESSMEAAPTSSSIFTTGPGLLDTSTGSLQEEKSPEPHVPSATEANGAGLDATAVEAFPVLQEVLDTGVSCFIAMLVSDRAAAEVALRVPALRLHHIPTLEALGSEAHSASDARVGVVVGGRTLFEQLVSLFRVAVCAPAVVQPPAMASSCTASAQVQTLLGSLVLAWLSGGPSLVQAFLRSPENLFVFDIVAGSGASAAFSSGGPLPPAPTQWYHEGRIRGFSPATSGAGLASPTGGSTSMLQALCSCIVAVCVEEAGSGSGAPSAPASGPDSSGGAGGGNQVTSKTLLQMVFSRLGLPKFSGRLRQAMEQPAVQYASKLVKHLTQAYREAQGGEEDAEALSAIDMARCGGEVDGLVTSAVFIAQCAEYGIDQQPNPGPGRSPGMEYTLGAATYDPKSSTIAWRPSTGSIASRISAQWPPRTVLLPLTIPHIIAKAESSLQRRVVQLYAGGEPETPRDTQQPKAAAKQHKGKADDEAASFEKQMVASLKEIIRTQDEELRSLKEKLTAATRNRQDTEEDPLAPQVEALKHDRDQLQEELNNWKQRCSQVCAAGIVSLFVVV